MRRFLFRQHGRYSLELKFRYLISRRYKKRKNSFNIKFYFFFPYSFNINPVSYPKEHFYEDQKLYLRFNTPVFSMEGLASEERSPFLRSRKMLSEALDNPQGLDMDEFVYETKLCGSIFKSVVRDSYYRVRKLLKREEPEKWEPQVQSMISGMSGLALRFHELTTLTANFSDELSYHTRMIDEYISLEMEKYLLWLLDLLRVNTTSTHIQAMIEKTVSGEMSYRKESGYASVSDAGQTADDFEEYAYRAKILKRYTSDVLFFNVRRKYQGKSVEHILYAAAAGIAMVFATLVAFLGQTQFGNLSTSLFILLVASYMLKDRLKDIFRDLFSKSIGSFFYDRGVKVYDPRAKRKLAYVKERVSFIDVNKLPPEVRKIRGRGTFESFLAYTASENVLFYEKNIRLNSRTIRKVHSRVKGIADINILSLRRLLRYLSVQYRSVPIVSEGRVRKLIPGKRIYHLNLVVWYQGSDASFIDRLRLIVDGKGIIRIEKVDSEDTLNLQSAGPVKVSRPAPRQR